MRKLWKVRRTLDRVDRHVRSLMTERAQCKTGYLKNFEFGGNGF
jgi:hypothetical protein